LLPLAPSFGPVLPLPLSHVGGVSNFVVAHTPWVLSALPLILVLLPGSCVGQKILERNWAYEVPTPNLSVWWSCVPLPHSPRRGQF
jgi:hypothetical protein